MKTAILHKESGSNCEIQLTKVFEVEDQVLKTFYCGNFLFNHDIPTLKHQDLEQLILMMDYLLND